MGLAVVPQLSQEKEQVMKIEEQLKQIGACGMGYPDLGLPCIRSKGHNSFRDCFALVESPEGEIVGCYMQHDGKNWVTDQSEFPDDIVTSTPLFKERKKDGRVFSEPKIKTTTDRRGLVKHSKARA